MAYERYTLRMKWKGVDDITPTRWLSVRQTPYFKSEQEAEEYYERNRDFINLSAKDREIAVFRIVHDEIMVKELQYNHSMTEEAIHELMLDVIEIVNPIGDAYTDLLTRFNEFINEFEKAPHLIDQ